MDKTDFEKSLNQKRIIINFDKLGLFNLQKLGRLNYTNAHPPLRHHLHKNAFEICYLARGRQKYEVNGETYDLKGDDVFLTYPNEVHGSGGNPEEKSVLYWVIISINEAEDFLNSGLYEGKRLIEKLMSLNQRKFQGNECLKIYLDNIISVYYSDSDFKRLLIRNYITEFIIKIIEYESKSERFITEKIQAALKNISDNIDKDINLDYLAHKAELSLSRFKQRFRNELGIPPREYIIRQKVEYAGNLLIETDRSITDIAYDLGFSSGNYFSTVFKRITGKTPTQFRNCD